MKLPNRPIAVISHERSGTHLCIDSLRLWFEQTHTRQMPFRSTRTLFFDLHLWIKRPTTALLKALRSSRHRPILKLHFRVGLPGLPEEFRAFYGELLEQTDKVYVVRDGRDALVSYFLFRQKFDNGTSDFAEYLRQPLHPEGQPVARYWSEHVDEWLKVPGIRIVRFEALRGDYAKTVTELGKDLRLTRTRAPTERIEPDRARWVRAIKRAFGAQRSTAVLPGKGDVGRWGDFFSESDKELFKREAGSTLLRLGYEATPSW